MGPEITSTLLNRGLEMPQLLNKKRRGLELPQPSFLKQGPGITSTLFSIKGLALPQRPVKKRKQKHESGIISPPLTKAPGITSTLISLQRGPGSTSTLFNKQGPVITPTPC